MRTSSTRRLSAITLSTLLTLFGLASPALAGAKGGDAGGDRPSVSGSTDDDSAPDANGDADNRHPSGKDRHEDKGTQGNSTSTPDQDGHGPERDYEGTDKPFVAGDGAGGMDKADQDGNNGCGNDDDFEDDNEGWCGQKPKHDRTTPPGAVKGSRSGDHDEDAKCSKGTTGSKRNAMAEDHAKGPKDCDDKPVCTDDMATAVNECDDDDTEVGNEVITKTCPKAGETLAAGETMPDGCDTSTKGVVTSTDIGPGAVLGTDLQNAPSAGAAAASGGASVLGVQFERSAPEVAAAGGTTGAVGASVLGAVLARTGLSFTVIAMAIALGLLAVGFALKRAGRSTSSI